MYRHHIRLAMIVLVAGFSLSTVVGAATKAERQAVYQASKAGNHNKAFSMAQKLAVAGDKWSQKMLGEYYRKGKGVGQDYVTARRWYGKAAKQGDVRSVARLGSFYYRGRGVTKDYSKAFEYYHAINARVGKKNAWVLRRIGHMYLHGQGVEKNSAAAVRWFRKAASLGDTAAQFKLANQYYLGEGLPQSIPAWLWWLKKSAQGGNKDARELLTDVVSKKGEAAIEKLKDRARKSPAQPSLLNPFGMPLGEILNEYSTILEDETFSRYDTTPIYAHRMFVQPPIPLNDAGWLPEYDEKQAYQAFLTPVSGTLYRVDAMRTYESTAICKASLSRFAKQLSSGMTINIVQNWTDTGDGSWRYVVTTDAPRGQIGGYEDDSWVVEDFQSLIGLSDSYPSAVVATMTCSDMDESESLISFVHLPSLEYRVAESFQSDPFLASYFAQPTNEATKTSSLLSPFGIPLTEVLQKEIRNGSNVKDGGVSHSVQPPLPSALFSDYTVRASSITERVRQVSAMGYFKDRQVCSQSINKALQALGKVGGLKELDWRTWGTYSGNDRHTDFTVGSEQNIQTLVKVSAGCQDGSYIENGRVGEWYGWARFNSGYANDIEVLEACVLNPESDCDYELRDYLEDRMGEFEKLIAEF